MVGLKLRKFKRTMRNRNSHFAGGTGLYFKALTDGLVKFLIFPKEFRNKIRTLHKLIGQKKFYQKLNKNGSFG